MGKTPIKHTLAGYIIKKNRHRRIPVRKTNRRKTFEQNNRNDGICWWTPETNRSGKVYRE